MKVQKLISAKIASLLTAIVMIITLSANAQTAKKANMMKHCSNMKECCKIKDGCMMKDGKMMMMKDGKTMPMKKNMVMKNGTTCKSNGECMMKDGKKMMMKNGDCMEMSGKMCSHKMGKHSMTKKSEVAVYTCPMHPEVIGVKGGKCPKCGMDLVKKD